MGEQQEHLQKIKNSLVSFFHRLSVMLHPEEGAVGQRLFHAACVGISLLLASINVSYLLSSLLQVACFVAGTSIFLLWTPSARRVQTVCRANFDYLTLCEARASGGCATWAFFAPDSPS